MTRATKRGDPDPAIKRSIDRFYQAYVRRWNPPVIAEAFLASPRSVPRDRVMTPLIKPGKDAALVKQMLAAWGEETVGWLIDEFFGPGSTDPRVVRSNHDVGALYGMAQYLLLKRQQPADLRTAENFDAASRATRPRER